MCFSLTITTWRLMKGADGKSINTNPPIYTCKVGTRRKIGDKKEKEATKRGREKRNMGTFCNQIYN